MHCLTCPEKKSRLPSFPPLFFSFFFSWGSSGSAWVTTFNVPPTTLGTSNGNYSSNSKNSFLMRLCTVLGHRLDHQNRRMDHPFVMLCLCYEFWVLKNNHQFLRHCSSESEPFLTKLNKSSLVGNELFDKSLPCIVNLTFVLALHFMKVQGQVIEFHRLDLNCFHAKQPKRVSS